VPSSLVRSPPREDANNVPSEQELEFDRWRVAVGIIKRMREAGINCELLDPISRAALKFAQLLHAVSRL
jgi:hypothetical protein